MDLLHLPGDPRRMLLSRVLMLAFAAELVSVAQPSPPTAPPKEKVAVSQQAGDSELGLFTGAVIPPGSGGAKVGGGANFAYAVNTWLYPYVEFSVLPGALNNQTTLGSSLFRTRSLTA